MPTPAASASTSSPMNRSQASAPSRGPALSSSSMGGSSVRTTGIGPVRGPGSGGGGGGGGGRRAPPPPLRYRGVGALDLLPDPVPGPAPRTVAAAVARAPAELRPVGDPPGVPGPALADAGVLELLPAAAPATGRRLDAGLAQDVGQRPAAGLRVAAPLAAAAGRSAHLSSSNESSRRRMTPSRSAHGQIRTDGTSSARIAARAT